MRDDTLELHFDPRPVGRAETAAPSYFLSPKPEQIMTRNLPHLPGQQFYTFCEKNRSQLPGHNRSAVSDVRVMSCSADFDKK